MIIITNVPTELAAEFIFPFTHNNKFEANN